MIYIFQSLASYKRPIPSQSKDDVEQYQRLAHLNEFCHRRQNQHSKRNKDLKFGESFIYNDKKKFVYCRVPKVACTTWKKDVLYTLDKVKTHPVNTSLNIVSERLVNYVNLLLIKFPCNYIMLYLILYDVGMYQK